MNRIPTASATIGPFFPGRYVDADANDLTLRDGRAARGTAITLSGSVTQADGTPPENLILELWQADAAGIFDDPADPRAAQADPDFCGWGRAATDAQGAYTFRTIRPGGYEAGDGSRRAPHLNLVLLFSGLMRELRTVVYFEDEPGNAADPVLAAVPAARRALLLARLEAPGRFRFDIRLRGAGETPFFDD